MILIIMSHIDCFCKRLKLEKCSYDFCICGYCNHCHIGGICPDHKFWYEKLDPKIKNQTRYPILQGQSHGGHFWFPNCDNHMGHDAYFE